MQKELEYVDFDTVEDRQQHEDSGSGQGDSREGDLQIVGELHPRLDSDVRADYVRIGYDQQQQPGCSQDGKVLVANVLGLVLL